MDHKSSIFGSRTYLDSRVSSATSWRYCLVATVQFWAVYKNGGGRPGPFYHVNDVSVYQGKQRGGEVSWGEGGGGRGVLRGGGRGVLGGGGRGGVLGGGGRGEGGGGRGRGVLGGGGRGERCPGGRGERGEVSWGEGGGGRGERCPGGGGRGEGGEVSWGEGGEGRRGVLGGGGRGERCPGGRGEGGEVSPVERTKLDKLLVNQKLDGGKAWKRG